MRFSSSSIMRLAKTISTLNESPGNSKCLPPGKDSISTHIPFFPALGGAGRWCLFKRRIRYLRREIRRMDCFLSRRGRCSSAWYRKAGKKHAGNFGRGRLLWRRRSRGPASEDVGRNCDDGVRASACGEERDDACAGAGTKTVGPVSEIAAEAQHPISGLPGGPAF